MLNGNNTLDTILSTLIINTILPLYRYSHHLITIQTDQQIHSFVTQKVNYHFDLMNVALSNIRKICSDISLDGDQNKVRQTMAIPSVAQRNYEYS